MKSENVSKQRKKKKKLPDKNEMFSRPKFRCDVPQKKTTFRTFSLVQTAQASNKKKYCTIVNISYKMHIKSIRVNRRAMVNKYNTKEDCDVEIS